jgi:predicted lipase
MQHITLLLSVLFHCVFSSSLSSNSNSSSFFSPTRARLFAHFSQVAYCESSQLSSGWSNCPDCIATDPNFHVSHVIQGTKAKSQVFVGSSNTTSATGNVVISFRGSDNLENWIKDLDFPKKTAYPKCTDCEIHGGFLDAWTEVQDEVLQAVETLLNVMPDAKVFVTGHSMGAAMAVLCAAELGASSHSLGKKIEAVYTFGQPRVGNQAFHDFYATGEHVSWRVTHYRDIVPHLPLEVMGFHHTSTEAFYNEDFSVLKICDGSGEDEACADQYDLTNPGDHCHYMNLTICDPTCSEGKN